jgi:peptidoglycan biosynthesis protein MviN/MurJ (putative lipid II flippase)
LLIGWFPVASTVVVALSAAWVRWQIVRPTSRLLGPSRRRVAVWTGRLGTAAFVALTLVINEALTLVPIAGPLAKVIVSGLQVAVVAWLNAVYLHWQVRREQANKPVAGWEWVVLFGTGALLIGSTVALTAAVIAAITAVDALAGYLLS